jgi:DNA-directed RNA polymerase subunit RPC12/RpoP
MGVYIQNKPIACPYCGNMIKEGRERKTPQEPNKMLVECVWICHRCGSTARRDQKTIEQ